MLGVAIAAGSALSAMSADNDAPRWDPVEPCKTVWLDLSEAVPEPGADAAARRAQHTRILAQQDDLAAQLKQWGLTEVARLSQVRNSIAVCLPKSLQDTVRRWPGVVGIRPAERLRDPRTDL
jgi:hypothetical protein